MSLENQMPKPRFQTSFDPQSDFNLYIHEINHQLDMSSLNFSLFSILEKKSYDINTGDVALFGSAVHGVPKDENIKNGRISIALFVYCHNYQD